MMLLRKLLALVFSADVATVAAVDTVVLDIENPRIDCMHIERTTQPKPDQSTWKTIREAYRLALGDPDEIEFPSSDNESDFRVPYEVRMTPENGWGIFATERVQLGELIEGGKNDAVFHHEHEYKQFLSLLPHDLACNVLHWSYLTRHNSAEATENTYVIKMHMDDTALINSAYDEEDANIGCKPVEGEDSESCYIDGTPESYALRDIEAGEELLEGFEGIDTVDELTWWKELCDEAIFDGDWGAELNSLYTAEKKRAATPDEVDTAALDIENPRIDCMHIQRSTQPKPDQTTWKTIREAYRLALGDSDEIEFPSSDNESDFRVPYELRMTPENGWGIFATERVQRGELIEGGKNEAVFHHEHEYKQFLSFLPHNFACNVLKWSYLTRDNREEAPENTYVIKMQMDDTALINSAYDEEDANIGCKPDEDEDTECYIDGTPESYALRDIEAGEELLEASEEYVNSVEELTWWKELYDDAIFHGEWGAELNALYTAEKKRAATPDEVDTAASDTESNPTNCMHVERTTQPKPDQSMWKNLRETYRLALGDSQDIEFPSGDNESDFHLPYEVRLSPGKGWGIFATASVQSGELIEGGKNDAVFHNEHEYKRFLSLLPHNLACNVLHWSFLTRDNSAEAPENTYVIKMHMDDTALVNWAGKDGEENIGCKPNEHGDSETCYIDGTPESYALRDIEAGEELLEGFEGIDTVDELTWWKKLCDDAIFKGDWGAELNSLYSAEKKSAVTPDEVDTAALNTESNPINCMHVERTTQPKPDQSMWKKLRETYRLALGDSQDIEFPSGDNESDFHLPYEVRLSPGKGWGIFATASVQSGELIEGGKNDAVFHNEHEYKRFLSLLPHNLACNVLHWSFLTRDNSAEAPENTYVIKMHMDDTALVNWAGKDGEENIGCKPNEHGDSESCYIDGTPESYALRDIEAGEELLEGFEGIDTVDELTWWKKLCDDAIFKGDWGAELNSLYSAEKKSAVTPDEVDTAALNTESNPINCMHVERTTQPKPDQSMWKKLRETYRLALGDSQDIEFPSGDNESDFHLPYEVRLSPGKGWGIFATASVQSGELIEGGKNDAVFHNEHEYKRFLSLLPHNLACNVLHWSFLTRDNSAEAPENTYVIKMHMDDTALVNWAGKDGEENIGCKPNEHGDSESCYIDGTRESYALRDIEAGEELLEGFEGIDTVDELTWWKKLCDDAIFKGDWGAELNALYTDEKERAMTSQKEL